MGFENPYRNINHDIGCAMAFLIVVIFAAGFAVGKFF